MSRFGKLVRSPSWEAQSRHFRHYGICLLPSTRGQEIVELWDKVLDQQRALRKLRDRLRRDRRRAREALKEVEAIRIARVSAKQSGDEAYVSVLERQSA